MEAQLLAAIGIGSNSVRLLVAEVVGGRVRTVERLETVTRLGSYRFGEGGVALLREGALRDTRAATSRFAHHAWERGAMLVGVIATEAVRAAANRGELTGPLERKLGTPVTVIGQVEEAELGWQAIAMGYEPGARLGVIDVGGASTELSVGRSGSERPQEVGSLKLGARTAMSRYRLDRPANAREVTAVLEAIGAEVGQGAAGLRPRPETGVVIGGTASVLAGLRRQGGHGGTENDAWADAIIEREWLEGTVLGFARASVDGRVAAGVPRDRADVIVAGGVILLAVLGALELRHFSVSERSILDGFLQRARMAR